MKYEVEILDSYKKNGIKDVELDRIPEPGEKMIITKERLDVLLGNNEHHIAFVKLIKEIEEDHTNDKASIKSKNKKNKNNI